MEFSSVSDVVFWFSFAGLLVAAACHDLKSFKIPNRLVAVLLFGWPLMVFAAGWSLGMAAQALAASAAVFAGGFALFAINKLGAGDVKLLGAATLWLGGTHLGMFLLLTTLAGAILAVGLVLFRKVPVPTFLQGQAWLLNLHAEARFMPYGVAIAAGGLIVWAQHSPFVY